MDGTRYKAAGPRISFNGSASSLRRYRRLVVLPELVLHRDLRVEGRDVGQGAAAVEGIGAFSCFLVGAERLRDHEILVVEALQQAEVFRAVLVGGAPGVVLGTLHVALGAEKGFQVQGDIGAVVGEHGVAARLGARALLELVRSRRRRGPRSARLVAVVELLALGGR